MEDSHVQITGVNSQHRVIDILEDTNHGILMAICLQSVPLETYWKSVSPELPTNPTLTSRLQIKKRCRATVLKCIN